MALPEPIYALGDAERALRASVGDDSAVLRDLGGRRGGDRYFVRALLELPIEAEDAYFGYGVWVEVSERDFELLAELWHDDEGWRHEPVEARLANELSPYAATEGLPVRIRLRDVQLLPLVELGGAGHELVEDQREGITLHRAHELAATVA
jgi:hypothetical protein